MYKFKKNYEKANKYFEKENQLTGYAGRKTQSDLIVVQSAVNNNF